jgi:hypothetical protein
MRGFVAPLLAATLALTSSTAFAGGPVVVEEEGQPEVVAETPRSGWIVPVIVGIVLICALACDNDDEPVAPG